MRLEKSDSAGLVAGCSVVISYLIQMPTDHRHIHGFRPIIALTDCWSEHYDYGEPAQNMFAASSFISKAYPTLPL
jgi:hypothetical protein